MKACGSCQDNKQCTSGQEWVRLAAKSEQTRVCPALAVNYANVTVIYGGFSTKISFARFGRKGEVSYGP